MTDRMKFRAWDGLNIVHPTHNMLISSYSGHAMWQFAYDPPTPHTWKVMQSTGLADVLGNEIFEGDILQENGRDLFLVVWDKDGAGFKLQHEPKSYQYPLWNRGVKMQIVGNLYQTKNPWEEDEDNDAGS